MWRFLLLLSFLGSAQAADEQPIEKLEAPKPEPVQPVQVWDSMRSEFVSPFSIVRRPGRRLILDQVPTVRDHAMQVDGFQVIKKRDHDLSEHRYKLFLADELAFAARYRGF